MAKTKREFMRAAFTKKCENARNMAGEKETISRWVLVDKKTERHIVDCRVYMSGSANASKVYASIWVSLNEKKKPDAWEYASTSGHGSASGYGYHKQSAAVQDAISSAGIELYGSPYNRADSSEKMTKRAHIDGCGDTSVQDALMAIAYAAGYTDCIVV